MVFPRAGRRAAFTALLAASAFCGAQAQSTADDTVDTITVTATRVEQPAFAVPASIDSREIARDNVGVNLSESLFGVAGLVARDRQNYAQDTQISIRGFGARSPFGIRGLRLYVDGIPATQPDGQGQVSHFNLASASRVEVLRGPFSALYGNSSGGVIQLFTADGDVPSIYGGVAAGSFDTWRANVGARGGLSFGDYNLAYSHFDTAGFRDHSQARRESLQGKLRVDLGKAGRLTLLGNYFDAPDAQDPLGLTRAQYEERPEQAAPAALTFNTRKSASQSQGGAIYDLDLDTRNSLRVLAYGGHRAVEQYLAIPVMTQANARHAGGVIDLSTDYAGADARWSWRSTVLGRSAWLVAGLSYDTLSQDRYGYENFVGSTLGVRGALRRDETNDVVSFDQYLQAQWAFATRWSLTAGLRHSRIEFESDDRYVTEANVDDSGEADYSATVPVVGLLYQAQPNLNLYGSYGKGFETPTLAELAYRPDGQAGLNFGLSAVKSQNAEVGAKLRLRPWLRSELALFQIDTDDEIVIATNSGGRTTYTNADRTRRQGVELSVAADLLPRLNLELAYTWLQAEVRDAYQFCSGVPCTAVNATVPAGARVPGVPESNAYAALRWGGELGWRAWVDARYVDQVPVNDTNTESAPSYHLLGTGGGYIMALGKARLQTYLRVDNLLDDEYIGSVIANDGNGRFYEPGPGRSVLGGIGLNWGA